MTILTDRIFRLPRIWSNDELRQVSPHVTGSVVNVSAWKDQDKQGGRYRDYFFNAREYKTTNWHAHRGTGDGLTDIVLDLEAPLPAELQASFDCAFSHTTLEHVFDVFTAFRNVCELSRDLVIVIVPFLQELHGFAPGALSDFWRFTPHALVKLFRSNGIEPVRMRVLNRPNCSSYVLTVGARDPGKWYASLGPFELPERAGHRLVRNGPLRRLVTGLTSRSISGSG